MKYHYLSGKTQDVESIKSVGDILTIDGVEFLVNEINVDEFEDTYNVSYTLEKIEAVEPTTEELQQL